MTFTERDEYIICKSTLRALSSVTLHRKSSKNRRKSPPPRKSQTPPIRTPPRCRFRQPRNAKPTQQHACKAETSLITTDSRPRQGFKRSLKTVSERVQVRRTMFAVLCSAQRLTSRLVYGRQCCFKQRHTSTFAHRDVRSFSHLCPLLPRIARVSILRGFAEPFSLISGTYYLRTPRSINYSPRTRLYGVCSLSKGCRHASSHVPAGKAVHGELLSCYQIKLCGSKAYRISCKWLIREIGQLSCCFNLQPQLYVSFKSDWA